MYSVPNFLGRLVLIAFLFSPLLHFAQQNYTIDQGGMFSDCGPFYLFDSDSTSSSQAGIYGPYSDNEDYTITFCSDGGGNVLTVGFGEMFSIDPSDTLYVYDGNSTAAPLIGAYNNNIQPSGVTTTTDNTSGCMTFRFVSDASAVDSGWRAIVNCLTVCQPIDPVIITTPALVSYGPDSNYTNICPGDSVFFSASGNYPNNGTGQNYAQSDGTSTFEWNFGEGTELTAQSGGVTYNDAQGYSVILTVTDVNNCQEQIIHKVRTGIPPTFSGIETNPDTLCFGDTVRLEGGFDFGTNSLNGATPNTGAITAGGTVTGQTFLPDGNGNSYTTSVGISGFDGQFINSGTDIQEICMNIEHSYIGDLDFVLICPNGTSIVLSDTYNGGGSGGTFLGDALDDGSTDPGIGMDYCFALGATWGTMTDENINGNTIPSTLDPGNDVLSPGDFQPDEHFDGLIGCPIDGDWTLSVTDNIGSDNGYIFEWGITLNPDINPNAEFYDVAIVNANWINSPDIITTSGDHSTALPTIEGDNQYTFQIEDEYGCYFDTTVNVHMLPELTAIATPDTSLCGAQSVQLGLNGITSSCTYQIVIHDSWGDGWNGALMDVNVNGNTVFGAQTVPDCGGITGCEETIDVVVSSGDQLTLNYTSGSFNSENTITIFDSNGDEIYSTNDPSDGIHGPFNMNCSGDLNVSWMPGGGLSDSTIADPIFNGSTTQSYVAEVYFSNHPECKATSNEITIEVNYDSIPYITGDTAVCEGNAATLTVNDADVAIWADNSNMLSTTFVPESDTTLIVTAVGQCDSVQLTQLVQVFPLPTISASADTNIVIQDVANLYATGGVSYQWSPSEFLSCDDCDTLEASPISDMTYYVTVTDSNGCSSVERVNISVVIPDLFIPTGFSPNGDGFNDVVYVRSLSISSMIYQVYDRWGGLVFESNDQATGWDGTSNGKKLDPGVYIYKFQATMVDGEVIEQAGNITLFR